MTVGESANVSGATTLANAYADANNYTRAEQVLREALAAAPDDATLLASLARMQALMGDYTSAVTTAYAALAIAPEYAFAMRMYTVALDGAGWVEAALEMAWRTAIRHPDNRLTHLGYADLLLKAGYPNEALVVIGEGLRLDPGFASSHLLRGQILARLGRIDESTASYEEVLHIDPGNALAVNNIGVNREKGMRWSGALRSFLRAARLDPGIGDLARRNIGVVLTRPLRLSTWVVIALGWLLFSRFPRVGSAWALAERITIGICTVALASLLLWLCRIVPRRTWRSVLRAQPLLALRVALVACAAPIGAVVTVVCAGAPWTMTGGTLLLLAGLMVLFMGRVSGD